MSCRRSAAANRLLQAGSGARASKTKHLSFLTYEKDHVSHENTDVAAVYRRAQPKRHQRSRSD